MSTVLLIAALWALAVPGSSMFVSELYILLGAFQQQAVLGGWPPAGSCSRPCTRCAGTRRSRTSANGERVSDDTPDLRRGELAIAVPLILILLAITAYPYGVMKRIGYSEVGYQAPAKVQRV